MITCLRVAHRRIEHAFNDRSGQVFAARVKLPPRSPKLNVHAERFVRSIKEPCLNRMIFFGEASLRKGIREFVLHYHRERNHQGLGNQLIIPDPSPVAHGGRLRRRERLGGMLNYYYRQAA